MKFAKPARLNALLLGVTVGLTACVANTSATRTYCEVYQPIYASSADTPETLRQIDRENGKYECICRANCPTER